MLKNPKKIIICEKDKTRRDFIKKHYPQIIITTPENCLEITNKECEHGGADVVLEVAGGENTFELAWRAARPNAIVTVVALYNKPMILPLPEMYGKNLIFKTGGVDGCNCEEILSLIEQGKIDTTPLITHEYKLQNIEKAYDLFENKKENVIKIVIVNS